MATLVDTRPSPSGPRYEAYFLARVGEPDANGCIPWHGPVNAKRRGELQQLFKDCTAGLVFVTTFLTRSAMVQYLRDIAWETEVWVAEAPSHMIHFNGERFLGPYDAE